VKLRADHCFDERVVLRREFSPGGEADQAAVGKLALRVEQSTFSSNPREIQERPLRGKPFLYLRNLKKIHYLVDWVSDGQGGVACE